MQAQKKPMPVGIEDFGKLIAEGYYFVDKTRFIKEYIDAKGEVTLITRPRRFGKTLTLSMLRYFFSVEGAEENRRLFAGLDIERAGEHYMKEQGSRPVVFLTLKDVRMGTWQDELERMALELSKLYRNYLFLLESPALTEVERAAFRTIWERCGSRSEMEDAVANLCRMLKLHFGQAPLLLLDEYDAPILFAWERGYYEDCIDFMRGFLSCALKTNPSLGSAVLTGVTRISKESIFSGLNNLEVCGVLSTAYADIWGFTPEETSRLMSDCGVEDKLPELKRWYDGYLFGGREIYNPWSVVNFVRCECKFQPYWLNTSGNAILKDLLAQIDRRRKNELEGLLQGKPVEAPVRENFVFADIKRSRDALLMLLMNTGYLKPIKLWQDSDCTEWASLQIPNREVRTAYRQEILSHIVPLQGETLLREMLEAMTAGDTAGFSECLSDVLRDFVSYSDTAQPESFYHGLLLGFSVLLEGKYRIESNRESGYGRFDIAFFPLQAGAPGVILEIKTVKTAKDLRTKAKNALRQIEDKAYIAELTRQGATTVWKYGIAFCGKRLALAKGGEE